MRRLKEEQCTISGAHKELEGTEDGAVEGPAQEGDRAGAGPLHGKAQPIVLVLQDCGSRLILAKLKVCMTLLMQAAMLQVRPFMMSAHQ